MSVCVCECMYVCLGGGGLYMRASVHVFLAYSYILTNLIVKLIYIIVILIYIIVILTYIIVITIQAEVVQYLLLTF